ncbi:hypothetical protein [Nocardioides sp. SLBN-35]|uniref:COG4705 family protein n=1 Tax=Nocardioides sp. SLBN-35 TaxID=2768445 RepID=UPI001152F7AD|nr:hypothetical protein [Nocardioides sp. SLBN-35]TQK70345.1 putative membrane-anchored protein [Nocardioides sp. SLBN-35]
MSTTASTTPSRSTRALLLNKVPEVTAWFWIIKVLCTTVGESFADWINVNLGVGLVRTAIIFTAVFAVALAVQMRARRYVRALYWLTVVVVSVTGTLYTDILTDQLGVPLWISTTVFSVALAAVFGIWWARERTLSIHSIVTTPREAFYWLAVLVTFALGTATGDWTLELTGWGPGRSVLLPLGLIAAVTALWRFGANPVLSFWVAYILTRPLGANIGDWLASPKSEQGLGLGTFGTSAVFLGTILATVVLLTITRSDVTERRTNDEPSYDVAPTRERVALAGFGALAALTVGLLAYANSQPHVSALDAEEGKAPSCAAGPISAGEAHTRAGTAFPAATTSSYRTIVEDTRQLVASGDQGGATKRITDLETAWDNDQADLQPADCAAWNVLDHQIDDVLTSVRASHPKASAEESTMDTLLTTLP